MTERETMQAGLADYLARFTTPGSEYRGKPFWAWNGRLEPDELRRQIRLFQRMGMGGFFMHSRVGLETPYLEDAWFDLVEVCLDEAKQVGLEAWLYDEDRWPSGQAGGLVTRDPGWVMRTLKLEARDSINTFAWDDDLVAVFTARLAGTTANMVRHVPRGELPALADGHTLLLCRRVISAPSPAFNGGGMLDTMNPEAVRRFIAVTYEAYAARFADAFGGVIPGIFTDEPSFGNFAKHRVANRHQAEVPLPDDHDSVPWTDRLPQVFRERYGYDLTPRLLEVFFDVAEEPGRQPRYHFHDCLTHLFTDAYARQIGQWCEQHGLPLTGHVTEEDTLWSQAKTVGSAMRFYEHQQIPGIDLLMENKHGYNTAKQCASVARQLGRRWRLSELYGCTGWHLSFEGQKAIGNWHAALGINLRCHHLSYYTMLGEAKRDFPPSIAYQSPWWEHYDKVEGYFGRIHAAMDRGEEVRDLLVIHPVESVWLLRNRDLYDNPRLPALDKMFFTLVSTLLTAHLDFDYGDEEMLSRLGTVESDGANPLLQVGRATYRAVLVPPLETIRNSTLALLRAFAEQGGQVVFAGAPPKYVDALPSPAAASLAERCTRVAGLGPELVATLAPHCRRVSIASPAGNEIGEVLYLLKQDDDAFYLLLVNTSKIAVDWDNEPLTHERTAAFPDVRVRGLRGCRGRVLELDPDTAAVTEAECAATADGLEIRTSLPRIGSRIFVIPKKGDLGIPAQPVARRTQLASQPLTADTWTVSLNEPNVLVLDRPRFRINGGAWRERQEILRIDRAVRNTLGLAPRGGFMLQPWAQRKWGCETQPSSRPARVELVYGFQVQTPPASPLQLGLECPQRFSISLNGQAIAPDTACGWWTDKSLETIPVDPALLRPGHNELMLTVDYDERFSGLEVIYLLGAFGVVSDGAAFTLTEPVKSLAIGDWCAQGLPFYSGCVTYEYSLEAHMPPGHRLFVRLPAYGGVAVRVLVDGIEAGIAAWDPNEAEITQLLPKTPGSATLQLQVLGHRRNSHGPLHFPFLYPPFTGPMHFMTCDAHWTDDYQAVPMGLLQTPELIRINQ